MHVTYVPTSPVTGSSYINRVELIDTKTNTLVGGYDIVANLFSTYIDSDKQKLFATVFSNGAAVDLDLSADPRYAQASGTSANQTVPEFGPITALVLVIAVISVITISKSKLRL